MALSALRFELPAAALAMIALASLAAAAQVRAPPAPHCLDAREVREVFQSDERTLAMALADGRRYRVGLSADCPGATASGSARLLAADGWMCGTGNEYVAVDGRHCPVGEVAPIIAAEYARHARASQTGPDGSTTLATIVVQGEARRGFAASHNYCFNPRHMRGWSEDAQGVIVEVNPRRSGGHRYYRVELMHSCPQLGGPAQVTMRSGVGIGLICGNPGDSILAGTRGANGFGGSGGGPRSPLVVAQGRSPDMLPTGSDRLQMLGARAGCPIRAVYPMDAG